MSTHQKIYYIILRLMQANYFRTEYAEDGYITITKKSEDSYAIDIQQVSYLDQATQTFFHFNLAELAVFLEKHIDYLTTIS